MDRVKYIAEMKNLLSFMEPSDRRRVLRYYEEQFDSVGDEGEQELIRSLGSPVRQVLMVEKQYREREEKGFYGVETAPAAEERTAFSPAAPELLTAQEQYADELCEEPYEDDGAELVERPVPSAASRNSAFMGEEIRQAFGVENEETGEEYDDYEAPPVRLPDAARAEATKASGGHTAAAVLLTPLILVAALAGLALALLLGGLALAPALAFGAAAVYLALYALRNLHYLPDMLAVIGVAVVCAAAALFFIWLSIWLVAEGIVILVRMIGGIYRRVLHGGAKNG